VSFTVAHFCALLGVEKSRRDDFFHQAVRGRWSATRLRNEIRSLRQPLRGGGRPRGVPYDATHAILTLNDTMRQLGDQFAVIMEAEGGRIAAELPAEVLARFARFRSYAAGFGKVVRRTLDRARSDSAA